MRGQAAWRRSIPSCCSKCQSAVSTTRGFYPMQMHRLLFGTSWYDRRLWLCLRCKAVCGHAAQSPRWPSETRHFCKVRCLSAGVVDGEVQREDNNKADQSIHMKRIDNIQLAAVGVNCLSVCFHPHKTNGGGRPCWPADEFPTIDFQ